MAGWYKARNRRKRQSAIYGMSLRDYDDRLAEQQGACLICKRTFPYPLCVDHCHETREVRSLLCIRCNLGLGNYEDNPVFLRNAANLMDEWLRKHPELRKSKGVEMIPTDELTDDGKASLMMRRAILHELRQPLGPERPPPADRLQQYARQFPSGNRAGQGDTTAIGKEALDRVDGSILWAAGGRSEHKRRHENGQHRTAGPDLAVDDRRGRTISVLATGDAAASPAP